MQNKNFRAIIINSECTGCNFDRVPWCKKIQAYLVKAKLLRHSATKALECEKSPQSRVVELYRVGGHYARQMGYVKRRMSMCRIARKTRVIENCCHSFVQKKFRV